MEIIYSCFYFGTFVIYLFSGLVASFNFRTVDKVLLKNYLLFCVVFGSYSFGLFLLLVKKDFIYMYLQPIFGFLAWTYYTRLINYYFGIKPLHSVITKYITLGASLTYLVYFIIYLVTGQHYIIQEIPLNTDNSFYQLLGFSVHNSNLDYIVVLAAIITIFVSSIKYCIYMYKSKDREPVLFFGLIFSILVTIVDCIFASDLSKYLFPIANAGCLIEVTRFYIIIQKETAKKVVSLENEIISISSLAEVGTLTAGIAHDIRNPIQVIKLAETSLRKKVGDLTELNSVKDNISKMNNIISVYLEMIYKNKVESKEFVLYDLINEAILLCSQKHDLKIKISLESDKNIVLNQNSNALFICLLNLISNACEAISHDEERWVKVTTELKGENIIIKVIDSGKGISSEIKNKIFLRQFSTKTSQEKKGHGIGLYLVRKVVSEQLSGSIRVDDENQNTCFEVSIPLNKS